ncbi:hypothetical protein D7B24_002315 [Verticillium nonalfalfae]|uniref:Uncharacterized protein n=1 Tax=Verticillium nonalfalfae TaxID=1051616 RepID=A0A3M9XYP8_9PEZI|nr:uncharacterized protein D7B24_002315 [Verticillium nonalfalfae]RNJ53161.1 hypothetical protein D7B24_002315 [Verticillium nonalfalfae]
MVSVKVLLALLPLALQATALPSPLEENHLERRVCVPPSNCSPIGNCEFCCRTGVTPNSSNCHSHVREVTVDDWMPKAQNGGETLV